MCSLPEKRTRPHRICISGGPGAGKSTCGDILRREMGAKVAFVPEAATLLFSGGFPRDSGSCAQHAIFSLQKDFEAAIMRKYPGRILLTDRGTVDGVGYMESEEAWENLMGTTVEEEFKRYDAIIYMQSAASVDKPINGTMLEGGNAVRTENASQARGIDAKLYAVWSRHPNFYLVESCDSFFEKIQNVVTVFRKILKALDKGTLKANE